MDIMLERILSLLPKKENGDFVRGAKKDLATRIGYDSGDIVSMWINGTSVSYKKKLYEISAEYDVSVEWLRGETDKKNKPAPVDGNELTETQKEFMQLVDSMSDDQLKQFIRIAKAMLEE